MSWKIRTIALEAAYLHKPSLNTARCQISAMEEVFSDLTKEETLQIECQRQIPMIATAGSYCTHFVCQQVDSVAQMNLSHMITSTVQTLTWDGRSSSIIFL